MPDLRSGIVHGFFVVEEEPHGFLLLDGYFFWGIRTNLPSFLASWLLAGRAPPRILHSGCRTDPGGPLRRVREVASISCFFTSYPFLFLEVPTFSSLGRKAPLRLPKKAYSGARRTEPVPLNLNHGTRLWRALRCWPAPAPRATRSPASHRTAGRARPQTMRMP